MFETMVDETAKYLSDHRLKSMVLGLSGGIDSTVTAAVCHEVVKRHPELKFIGVSMPCTTNTVEENDSASKAMRAFCTEYWVENLQAQYLLMKATCEQHYESTALSQGNIKARLRMIYLYNLASVTGGMVMDTDNLTEHYLGFWTIHGDVADYNPIGGLWKHEVYALCKYLFTEVFTDTTGHTYEEVDDILNSYISKKDQPEAQAAEVERLNKAYGAETVERVLNRHRRSEFKRKRLPIAIERSLYE